MNTITRWRLSTGAFDRIALCQLGFALRSEEVCVGVTGPLPAEGVAVDGASLT
jgi:hypothetical protein